jgi:hypothetical protein
VERQQFERKNPEHQHISPYSENQKKDLDWDEDDSLLLLPEGDAGSEDAVELQDFYQTASIGLPTTGSPESRSRPLDKEIHPPGNLQALASIDIEARFRALNERTEKLEAENAVMKDFFRKKDLLRGRVPNLTLMGRISHE